MYAIRSYYEDITDTKKVVDAVKQAVDLAKTGIMKLV